MSGEEWAWQSMASTRGGENDLNGNGDGDDNNNDNDNDDDDYNDNDMAF